MSQEELFEKTAASRLTRRTIVSTGTKLAYTTYDAVSDLLRDHHRFLQNPAGAGHRGMSLLM